MERCNKIRYKFNICFFKQKMKKKKKNLKYL